MPISRIAIYLDYKMDESYTPSKIQIKAGGFGNFQHLHTVDVNEPSGWIEVTFDEVVKTFHLQISVLQNHQNGKDTHVRQIKVFTSLDD